MHSTLRKLINQLPPRKALDPLRDSWPGLCGGIFQIDEHRWVVFIDSSEPEASFVEVDPSIDVLFQNLGLAEFVQKKNVRHDAYTFWLVEPLSPKAVSSDPVVL